MVTCNSDAIPLQCISGRELWHVLNLFAAGAEGSTGQTDGKLNGIG